MKPTIHLNTIVIGAGISGLTAGFHLKKAGQTVFILEEDTRPGGVIKSEKKDGFLLEYGPNTILPNLELMEMIDGLGLSSAVLMGDPRLKRFIQFGGRLHQLPMSPPALMSTKLLTWGGKLRLFAEPFIGQHHHETEETLADFARRRLGSQAAERLLDPFVSGVWAGDTTKLSASASFPRLVQWEKSNGSIVRGLMANRKKNRHQRKPPKGLLSFQEGIQVLVRALADYLEPDISLNARVKNIAYDEASNRWLVDGLNIALSSDRLILAAPPWQVSPLIESWAPAAAAALNEIPHAPLAALHLGLKRTDVTHDLQGFGYLIAPSEKLETLGCLFSSSLFPGRAPAGSVLLTVFVGGARHPDSLKLSDGELFDAVFRAIQPKLGITNRPQLLSLTRYERSIPQYTLGHTGRMETLKQAERKFPGLRFAGNIMGGISVGDVIKHAKSVSSEPVNHPTKNLCLTE